MNLLKGLAKIAVVGVAIWTQLWPERGGLEAILNQSTVAVMRRHVAPAVQGADGGAVGAWR